VNPQEQADYNAFNNQAVVDTKIALGEGFDAKYPLSRYQEQVDTSLSFLYFNKGDYAKFYAASDRVLAINPKSVPVLELVGWVIPRDYNASDPSASAKLDRAEKYEKRALAEIAAMKKPRQVTQTEFENSKSSLEWRAHSGLGTIFFRRHDFADSAAELQTAIKQQGTGPDPADLYILGVDLEHLGHMTQAADEFAQCSITTDSAQEECQKAYEGALHAAVESVEEKAYDAFNNAPNAKAEIQLGEKFDQTYPSSQYRENVDSTLLSLYEGEPDWTKFYATANTVLAKDPDNVPVLALVGWVIPRHYDASTAGSPTRLTDAEKYEKHVLDLIATMQKPADLTEGEFEQAKANATWRAHSGLGVTYFRLGDYADAAAELQLATANKSQTDPWDFYILGTSLHKLKRDEDAIQAFSDCAAISGYLQAQCTRDVAAVSSAQNAPQSGALLTAVSAKSPLSAAPQPVARDIPPSTPEETVPAIRTETVIVPVRVVVRDNKGRAVTNLTKENFRLYQDKQIEQIVNFTAMSNGNDATGVSTSSAATKNVGITSIQGVASPQPASRFIVLFFDDVHLYFADMAQIRSAAEKYLSSLRPQDRVAIATASGQGSTDFTDDRDKLHASLAKLMPHPFPGGSMAPAPQSPCPPAMTYTEASAIVEQDSEPVLAVAGGDFVICDHIVAEDPKVALEIGESHAHMVAATAHVAGEEAIGAVLDQLQNVVRHLAVMPGQRNIVVVSPGFSYGAHGQRFAEITDLAIRDNVIINTLDARGIYIGDGKWNPDRFQRQGYGHDAEYAVLQDLADSTGGLFIHFNNDFAGSMREMSEPPEAYYLLGYAPQNLQPDGKFHVLKVSLTSGAHGNVQARRGFFAPSHLETPEEAAKREVDDAMFSDEIQHDLPVRLESSLTRDTSGAQEVGVKAHVDAAQLHFVKTGATNQENLTIAAALFDSNGNYVTGTEKVDQMNLDDTTLAQIQKTGFYTEIDLSAKPGGYVLRMVARDSNDGHISAENANVTVPN
jgi:VWFA-related protein